MNATLRVLHLEDSRRDAELIQSTLEAEGLDCHIVHVKNQEGFEAALARECFDVILSDYSLPHYNGLSALDFARHKAPAVPFILLSGVLGEELAVASLKTGAADYILKQRLSRLGTAVERAVCEARERAQRKRAEEALEQMRRHNELILHSTGEGICGLDSKGRITFVNPSAANLLGYKGEELIGQSGYALLHRTKADGTVCEEKDSPICATYKRGTPHHGQDTLFWRKGGASFPAEYVSNPIYDEQAQLIGAVVTFRDITERKQVEQQIREQAALLDKAQDAIFVRDLQNRIGYWNRGAERIYGWAADEVMGKDADEWLSSEAKPGDGRKSVLEQGDWIGELQQRTKSGREVIVQSRWTLMHDSGGKPQCVLVINTDITEKKKLEAQFLRAQRMESVGALAGGIAHDLNNILAPILMVSDLLQEKLATKEDRQMLEIVKTSAARGSDMVKQILSFARGVSGEHTMLQVKHLVTDMGKLLQETFPRSIKIQTEFGNDLHLVKGDATQLHQVLMNLCVNARDAMADGGSLTITAANLTLAEKHTAMHQKPISGPFVVLTVADTGQGIPPNLLEKIYEPFFTTKGIGKGTGLGLSTVLAIIKTHNGFVEVCSHVGEGTTFHVYLPASTATEVTLSQARPVPSPMGQGEQILVVDDESALREITRETLGLFNYQVLTAKDGTEAVALFHQHRGQIKVVITDMMMPNMDGTATIQALQQIDPQVRIICVSGLGSKPNLAAAAQLNVQASLNKPYSSEKLLATLRRVIDDHALATN